ncbi:MAG: sulfite exporter TauE/SafE family protein [Acidobacteria bacterium]|nr:sulfite exporter TauE/SafE family protein [Acidobacteriota bacterium]
MSDAELDAYAADFTPGFLANLALTVNERPAEIRVDSKKIYLKEGAGNLPTLRIEWDLAAAPLDVKDTNRVAFENKNFAERIGWNEIVVSRAAGVEVFDSNAFGSGVTDEIKTYPAESLDAPLAERAARFSFTTNPAPVGARLLENRDGRASAAVQRDRLAELIAVPEVTPALAVFGLLLAFGLGALHAMSPGHGKTVVGAYLVGSRGTPKHAAFLGLTVTVTHTLGVFALGLVTLFASNYILPEKLMPFLGFVSGLMVLYIGLTMFKTRLFAALGWEKPAHGHSHDHDDGHSHDHDGFTHTHDGHTHSHLPPAEISWKSLLALGISGGLLPCPSALVLMLSAISLGRIGYGLVLTTAFSFGLAATLTAVGLLFLSVGKVFGGTRIAENRLVKLLPVASAFVIAGVGAVICYNSVA